MMSRTRQVKDSFESSARKKTYEAVIERHVSVL